MAEIKAKTILAVNVSGNIKTCYVLDPNIDLSEYQIQGYKDDTITLINDKGVRIEIEAQFNVKFVGK